MSLASWLRGRGARNHRERAILAEWSPNDPRGKAGGKETRGVDGEGRSKIPNAKKHVFLAILASL